jgi:hypothetical protein
MKKKRKSTAVARGSTIASLIARVRALVRSARQAASGAVNTLQVLTNFQIGWMIVEHEQQGQHRAGYGKELLGRMSASLIADFGRGFSETNLKLMRQFYLLYPHRAGEISRMAPLETPALPIRQKASDELTSVARTPSAKLPATNIGQKPSDELLAICQTPSGNFTNPFKLSWSNYVVLLTIKDPDERSFYWVNAS